MTSYTVECKQASSDDSWRAVATVEDPQTFGGHTPMSTRPHSVTPLHSCSQERNTYSECFAKTQSE